MEARKKQFGYQLEDKKLAHETALENKLEKKTGKEIE